MITGALLGEGLEAERKAEEGVIAGVKEASADSCLDFVTLP